MLQKGLFKDEHGFVVDSFEFSSAGRAVWAGSRVSRGRLGLLRPHGRPWNGLESSLARRCRCICNIPVTTFKSTGGAITICFHNKYTHTALSRNPVLACSRFAFLWRRLVSAFRPSPPAPGARPDRRFIRLALSFAYAAAHPNPTTLTADHIKILRRSTDRLVHNSFVPVPIPLKSTFFATPLAPLHQYTACNRDYGEGHQALRRPRGKHSPVHPHRGTRPNNSTR